MDPLLHILLSEVDDIAQPQLQQAQVGESLRLEYRVVGGCCFDLDNDTIFNQQIQSERCGELISLLLDRYLNLTIHREPSLLQLPNQCLFVNTLKQPWPAQRAMDFDRTSNDVCANLILRH